MYKKHSVVPDNKNGQYEIVMGGRLGKIQRKISTMNLICVHSGLRLQICENSAFIGVRQLTFDAKKIVLPTPTIYVSHKSMTIMEKKISQLQAKLLKDATVQLRGITKI